MKPIHTLNEEYNLLEGLLIESLTINYKNSAFFMDEDRFNIFYENFLRYSELKLLRLEEMQKSLRSFLKFP